MGINAAYLEIRLSGGAGNSNQNASLGGAISNTRVLAQSASAPVNVTGVVIDASDTIAIANYPNKTYDDVTKQESFSGMTDYRCFYAKNTHPSETAYGASLIIDTNTIGGDTLYLGKDPAGIGGTPTTIANENTAPAGETFNQPSE